MGDGGVGVVGGSEKQKGDGSMKYGQFLLQEWVLKNEAWHLEFSLFNVFKAFQFFSATIIS